MTRSTWESAYCGDETAREAVASWFKGMVEPSEVLKADILVDIDTDKEKKVRALLRRKQDGKLREAIRTLGGRNYTITVRDPGADILKGFTP